MALPFPLDTATAAAPTGLPYTAAAPGGAAADAAKFPDRVEIGGTAYPCRVTRAISARRRDEMDTEFGRVAFVVRFPARPAGVAVNTPILWTVDDGVAMDPRYVLIAMIGVLRPDENDSFFAVPCEWKGAEVAADATPAEPGDAGPAGPVTPTDPIVPVPPDVPAGTGGDATFSVQPDTYIFIDGSTATYAAARTVALPADGISYVWLDEHGNVQVTP